MNLLIARRALLGLVAVLASACASFAPPAERPPIVFVHGNGDSAALWLTTLWRFESNGWPRARLHAVDMPRPLARNDDAVAQDGRSSSAEQANFLAAEVDKLRQRTGAAKVVLVGNSRGGNAIRAYIANGGDKFVSHAVLGGTPNHGVWAHQGFLPGSEFNGTGPFLKAMNAPKGPNGDEVTPGVKWLTLRSDGNDKFAQPDGVWIGQPGVATHVTADGPALKGALNLVLPGLDHREVSYHRQAFAKTYEFITGAAPVTEAFRPETQVVLDGLVSGLGAGAQTNLPLAGATVEVYAVNSASGERQGSALHRKLIGADGRWGPFTTGPQVHLEFVLAAPSYDTLHVYRQPFPRSSSVVNLRAERLAAADKTAAAVLNFVRPRGYFGLPRDVVSFDGINPAPGVPQGVAGVAGSKLVLREGAGRTVLAQFNNERLAARAWPAGEGHTVTLELSD